MLVRVPDFAVENMLLLCYLSCMLLARWSPQRSTQPLIYAAMSQDVTQQVTGSSLSGNMLNFQASVSGNGQRFSASQMRLWHSPCQRTPLGCNLVSHVSACWLTGLGLGTPSRYPARTISWNACKLLLLLQWYSL